MLYQTKLLLRHWDIKITMTNIRPLSSELAEEAYHLFQENESRIKMVLIEIKTWLSKHPHFKFRMDDQWLIAFARGCKYSLECITKKLENYYSLRTEFSDLFRKNKDPQDPTLNYLIHTGSILVYQNRKDPTSPVIGFTRVEFDHSKASLNDALKLATMVTDICLYDNDNLSICGFFLIYDLKNLTLSLMGLITIDFIRILLRLVQDCNPMSIKGVHIINAPLGFQTLFELVKLFSSEKMKKRYFVHSTLEDMYSYLRKDQLPNEYGGNAGSVEEFKEMWIEKFKQYRDWLIDDEQYCIDESLRVKKLDSDGGCNVM